MTIDVEKMLRDGATADEVNKMLQKEVAKTQEKLENEKKAAAEDSKLDKCRYKFVTGLIDYTKALGFIPPTTAFNAKEIEDFVDDLRELEKEFGDAVKVLKPFLETRKKGPDSIIEDFLRTL